MTEAVVHIEPAAPLTRVLQLMVSLKSRSFPVIGADHQLVGMISREDVIRALKEATQQDDQRTGPTNGPQSRLVGDDAKRGSFAGVRFKIVNERGAPIVTFGYLDHARVNAHAIVGRSLARRRSREVASQPPRRGVHIDVWLPLRHGRRFSRDGLRCFAGCTWMHYRPSRVDTWLRDGAHRAIWSQPTSSARAPTYPPIAVIAQSPNFNPDRLAHFRPDPHPKMPELPLSRTAADDIAASHH